MNFLKYVSPFGLFWQKRAVENQSAPEQWEFLLVDSFFVLIQFLLDNILSNIPWSFYSQ